MSALSETQILPVIGAKAGVMVEVAPGKKVQLTDPDPLPRYCIAELVPLGGGTYRTVPRILTEWMSFQKLSLQRLGITCSENTLHRLGRAGLIDVRQPSPGRYEFNYQSWLRHCQLASDPEFWDTPGADRKTPRQKYQEAL